jgi:hypothetical protein
MNLRRGFLRLGIGSATVWIVFWTCAYEISPYTSHNPEPASLAISITAWSVLAPCLIAAVVLGGWAAAGSGQIIRTLLELLLALVGRTVLPVAAMSRLRLLHT